MPQYNSLYRVAYRQELDYTYGIHAYAGSTFRFRGEDLFYTGVIVFRTNSDRYYCIEGTHWNNGYLYTELEFLSYLYKQNPSPELMVLIMELE